MPGVTERHEGDRDIGKLPAAGGAASDLPIFVQNGDGLTSDA